MYYLMSPDLFNKLSNQMEFASTNGYTYKEYIKKNIILSHILNELIETSTSETDALEILKFFQVGFTHDYFESLSKKKYTTNSENIKLEIKG